MKNLSWFFTILILPNICFGQVNKSEEKINTQEDAYTGEFAYQIGSGDTIQINVWRHPDLDLKVRVRPDGKIAFPLIDEINVQDKTPEALKKELTKRLSTTLRDPEVTINVIGFQSKKIFVLGEVNQPGVYPFEGQERVLDALSKAMGYKDESAALKSIIIIKNSYDAKPHAVRVNILDLIKKGNPKGNIMLEPGDIVFVPKTFISDLNKFIDQFFTKTDPALKYYLDIYNIRNPGILQ